MMVISGGQTGADIAGIKTAKKCGLKTGGYIPRGFLTLDGNKPEYKKMYELQETATYRYPERTELNAKTSDGTIWFGQNKWSAGKQCTFKFIKKHKKPYLDLDVDKLPDPEQVVKWIQDNNIKILNIAGNSEQTTGGMERIVGDYLTNVFKNLTTALKS
jgi:hypothetical protein